MKPDIKQPATAHVSPSFKKSLLAHSLFLPLTITVLPALAQSVPERQSQRVTALEEVVVTARRRAESLQEVPIAITALSDEMMRTNAIENFNQVRHHVPALTISNAGTGVNTPQVSLRGQRTSEPTLHQEGAVPMYMSDVVVTPEAGTNMIMYDLESVQVLKGPQGTLFGRNSTGGALLFTPKRPGEEFGGYAQFEYGNYDRIGTEFAVDLPASDKLMFRLAGKTVDRDGYQKNIINGDELWDEKSRALRLSMLVRPTENLENLLVLAWDRNDTAGAQPRLEAYRTQPLGTSPALPHFQDDLERSLARDPMRVESDQPGQYEDVENWFVANTTEYTLNDSVTLKNILGYRKVELASIYDADGSAEALANMSLDGLPAITESEMFSNEFQVLGTAYDDRLDWIVGAYYWQLEGEKFSRSNLFGIMDNIQGGEVENKAWAVFAQGSYEVTDRLSATLGARWSWDRREIDLQNQRTIYANGVPVMVQCTVEDDNGIPLPGDACSKRLKDDWNSPTWLASADYQIAPGTMVYGSITTGYRAGGFNGRAANLTEQSPFDEETVITYELGLKTDWDYRSWSFRTNVALYHQDFEDIQRTVSLPAADGSAAFITMTVNAAKATIQGAEIEFHANSDFGLDFNISYAHVNTEYKEYIDQHQQDQSGQPIEWVPQDQVTATLRYNLPLDPGMGDFSVQANYYYQSEQRATLWRGRDAVENRTRDIGSYNLLNYSADWRSVMGSSFDVSLYVKNATDKRYPVGGLTVVESLGVALWNYGEPRTYGASLRYNF